MQTGCSVDYHGNQILLVEVNVTNKEEIFQLLSNVLKYFAVNIWNLMQSQHSYMQKKKRLKMLNFKIIDIFTLHKLKSFEEELIYL